MPSPICRCPIRKRFLLALRDSLNDRAETGDGEMERGAQFVGELNLSSSGAKSVQCAQDTPAGKGRS
jgi:hypothetical protein